MNSARVIVPIIAFGTGDVAAHPASGFDDKSLPTVSAAPKNPQTFILSRILSGIVDSDIIENKTDERPTRGDRVNAVRYGGPISTTTQKRPEGRTI
jgi:hypothetical protein